MFQRLAAKFFKPKHCLALALILLAVLVVPTKAAHAGALIEVALNIFGTLIVVLVWVAGQLILVVIAVLVKVAQYNNFITAPAVVTGWVIVRDLCNMFFVLILLVIAFATILRLEGYSIKQLLKRVIIFALLINFSKMICGLLIDFAQVIMLTFVNGFKDVGGSNFTTLLGLDKLLSMEKQDLTLSFENAGNIWEVIVSYLLALLYAIVMLVVMVALLGTLVSRIVMLWIYIILSPLAYLGAVAPLTKKIVSTWWGQFSQNLVTGPILAFFIWLSLATLGQFSDNKAFLDDYGFVSGDSTKMPVIGKTEVGTTDHLMRLAVSLGLLIGGLMVAKTFGQAAAGGAASAALGGLKRGAGWLKKQTVGRARRVAVAGAKATGRAAWGGAKATGRVGLGLAKSVDYKIAKGIMGAGYKSNQGFITRGATGVYNNLMTKQGLKNTFNKATGHKFNRVRNMQKAAAATNRYHVDENGVRYDWDNNKNDGTLKSKTGQEFTKFKAFMPNSFKHKFVQYMHGSKAGTAKDTALAEKSKKEYEELMKPYKDKSKEEIWSLIQSTGEHSKLKGMYAALGAKGEFRNQEGFDKAKAIFATDPAQMKSLMEATQAKQAELVFNLSNADEKEALEKLVQKGKVKMDEQNLNSFNFKHYKGDDPNKTQAENEALRKEAEVLDDADKAKLAYFAESVRHAQGEERWASTINKIGKESNPKTAGKLAEAFGVSAKRGEYQRIMLEGDVFANESKADILGGRIVAKQVELDVATLAYNADPANAFKAQRVDDLDREKQVLSQEKTVLDKEREGLIKESDKESAKIKGWRSDRIAVDVNGDANAAFSDIHGRFVPDDFEKYDTEASAKQLSNINPDTIADIPEAIMALANAVSHNRIKTLEISGNNPGLAKLIAKAKTANYDPESAKIVNIYNDIDANLSEAKVNGLIQTILKNAGIKGSNNLGHKDSTDTDTLNGIRNELRNNAVAPTMDEVKKYLRGQGGKFSKI